VNSWSNMPASDVFLYAISIFFNYFAKI